MTDVFSDLFISHLFELVEQTRFMPDETFNYSVIKLTVSIANYSSRNYSPSARWHSMNSSWLQA